MPKIVTPLSLSQIKTAKPKDKVYKLSDGGGWLYGFCRPVLNLGGYNTAEPMGKWTR